MNRGKQIIAFTIIMLIVLTITISTGNPLLLIAVWYMLYNIMCDNALVTGKGFKTLVLIPIFEFVAGIIVMIVMRNYHTVYEMGLIVLGLIFSAVLNGFCYLWHWWRIRKK